MSLINVDRLRMAPRSKRSRCDVPARANLSQGFVKGPIPLPWLKTAARLPGKSMHAGIALWYVAGLTRSRVVPLSNIAGQRFGLDRNAKYRALQWLEGAGLVAVERKLGRAPLVTILEPEGGHDRQT